jgi:uncharacterized protein
VAALPTYFRGRPSVFGMSGDVTVTRLSDGIAQSGAESITALAPHLITRPIMLQNWNNLAALHWRVSPGEVQRLLPQGFTVDVCEESAWVGLIPFEMERIRIPRLPAFGMLSSFPETNLRTYILDRDGRRGVWFFSLDVTRFIPAAVARITYRLPYCWAAMGVEHSVVNGTAQWEYWSRRRWPKKDATSHVTVRVGDLIPTHQVSELDHFLSARWALGTTFGPRLMWAKVEHPTWPLHQATATGWRESLFTAAGLRPPSDEPIVRWSPGVEVSIERPRVIRR